MKNGTPILFMREKVIHSKQPDLTLHRVVLEEIPAVYIGESDSWCRMCHEPEQGHTRKGRRKHPFEPETGATIEVRYPNEEAEIRHHVMQGDTANCWKIGG